VKLFLAAPFFSEAEREFNSETAKRLREHGFDVWLAQEGNFGQQDYHKEKDVIYQDDIIALKASDTVVAILDGVDVDSGVAFEIGYAKALGKTIIGLKTDYRSFSRMQDVNLMLEVALKKICASVDEITDLLDRSESARNQVGQRSLS
jgi:nucleoside 2-deoxyribosyltransferase